jgi:putative oxidoreductase
MVQFFKDLGLAGAALILLGVFAQLGDEIGLTITGPLFG